MTKEALPGTLDAKADRLNTLQKHAKDLADRRVQTEGGDDCNICNDAEWWKTTFGSGWCELRNEYCGPDGLECPGFPQPCD